MKTCFISAPINIDLSVLKAALQSQGMRPVMPFELPITGANFRNEINRAIKKAHLFIGVLSKGADNLNVLFELGFASAQRKRVAIIQDKSFELPPSVSGLPILKSEIHNQIQIELFLSQLSLAPKGESVESTPTKKTKPLSSRAKKLISQIKTLGQQATHHEFEAVLVDALRASGIKVIAESKSRDQGYDFALWLDEIEYPVGNPILVELKIDLKLPTARALRSNFLARRDFSLGKALLVVYLTGPKNTQISSLNVAAPLVMFISATELLTALEDKSLADFIRNSRNRLAHGM